MNHTPGPWHVGMKPGPIIYGPHGEQVADLMGSLLSKDEQIANVKLIAEAPAMLEALRNFVEAAEISFGKDKGACGGECNICRGRAILDRIEG